MIVAGIGEVIVGILGFFFILGVLFGLSLWNNRRRG